MARKKQIEKVEVPESEKGLVGIVADRDYCGRTLNIRKGDTRLIPFEIAQKIIADHGNNAPIRIVKSLSSPFNKAIEAEETK